MGKRLLLAAAAWAAVAAAALAQPANDECIGALFLPDASSYCSTVGELSNVGATTSPQAKPFCQPDEVQRDVWVSFRATATNVSVSVVGRLPRDGGGTLEAPQLVLYGGEGGCGALEEVACVSDPFESNVVQVLADSLQPGELYYVRLGARDGNVGTFKLCIEQFDFVPEPKSDCVDGVLLCDKEPFTVPQLIGAGREGDEVAGTCIREEFSSVWYKWTCDEAGDLGFVLTPSNPVDDLDFVVYELPDGIDGCATKRLLRCEAAGENISAPLDNWERCSGETGLRAGETDNSEPPGCRPANNNFVANIEMVPGRSYALMVNNFSDSGNGFSIEWTGSGTFVGPKPGFSFTPDVGGQCDLTEFRFVDETRTNPGATNKYQWFFGSFAVPAQHDGPAPPTVTYGSFGEKVVTLRLRSSDGCVVTETRSLFVEPCCTPEVAVVARQPQETDPTCAGTPTGAFTAGLEAGDLSPRFSVNGGPYLPDDEVGGLFAGEYDVFIENIKGCRDTTLAVLEDPPPLTVNIGGDHTIAFGDSVLVGADVNRDGTFDYAWTGADSVRCLDDACSEVYLYGLRPGELSLAISSAGGCTAVDRLLFEVRTERPLYAPTAFSPDGDAVNDRWTLYGPPVLAGIKSLRIFDRWGDLVYSGEGLTPGDERQGWDGTHLGRALRPAVFAWVAEVEYVDGVVLEVAGDVNLLR